MKIGFTGTRQGLTEQQVATLCAYLHRAREFHHGACRGADAEAVGLLRSMSHVYRIVAHPGVSAKGGPNDDRDADAVAASDVVLPEQTHFARNRDIVAAADLVVGCPLAMEELPGGGTWFTLRHARDKARKPTVCIWPDGTVAAWNGAEA